MSQTKKIGLAVVGIIGLVVAYWLISPLFINKQVHESMDDLLKQAGLAQPSADVRTQPVVLPELTPPPGKDPRTESKGPTSPPPEPASVVHTISMGSFEGQAGHSGSGSAALLQVGSSFFVRLEDDFTVTNGPDLYVGFGKDGHYETGIAPLKGNSGSQNYEIPSEINAAGYNEVWIWCRAFSVPFARAVLR